MKAQSEEVTQLLIKWGDGDQAALDKLMPLVYKELHKRAKAYMRRQAPGHTLQTTAIINEVFIKLIPLPEKRWQNRDHFFGVASRAMRHVLVDYARRRGYLKRGGAAPKVSLDEAILVSDERAAELVALHDAMEALAKIAPRKCQVVEMRYFGGLSVEETAKALNVSPDTVAKDWRMAKSWLLREMSERPTSDAE